MDPVVTHALGLVGSVIVHVTEHPWPSWVVLRTDGTLLLKGCHSVWRVCVVCVPV